MYTFKFLQPGRLVSYYAVSVWVLQIGYSKGMLQYCVMYRSYIHCSYSCSVPIQAVQQVQRKQVVRPMRLASKEEWMFWKCFLLWNFRMQMLSKAVLIRLFLIRRLLSGTSLCCGWIMVLEHCILKWSCYSKGLRWVKVLAVNFKRTVINK